MSWHSKQRIRSALVDAAQIAGFVAVVIALWVAIFTMWDTQDQVKILNATLSETKDSSEKLERIIEKNNQLLETLNKAVIETAYQTDVQTYDNGKPFAIKIENCIFDESSGLIEHNVGAEDRTTNPATIDFRVHISYGHYTKPITSIDSQLDNITEFATIEEIVGPGKDPVFQIGISSVLNNTVNLDRPELYITYKFTYAPYSAAKNAEITRPDASMLPHLLLGFEINENTGEWEKITDNKSIACR